SSRRGRENVSAGQGRAGPVQCAVCSALCSAEQGRAEPSLRMSDGAWGGSPVPACLPVEATAESEIGIFEFPIPACLPPSLPALPLQFCTLLACHTLGENFCHFSFRLLCSKVYSSSVGLGEP
ncbi:hypothetical protein KC19_11G168900, partial [Ceratodon purpureus]